MSRMIAGYLKKYKTILLCYTTYNNKLPIIPLELDSDSSRTETLTSEASIFFPLLKFSYRELDKVSKKPYQVLSAKVSKNEFEKIK